MFQATFRCVESMVVAPQPAGDKPPTQTGKVVLHTDLLDEHNKSVWNGTPNGALQLGQLPASVWGLFSAGGTYRLTIEPL